MGPPGPPGKPKTKTKEEKHISSWAICFNHDNDHNNNDYDNGGGNMTILPLNKMSWLKWELKKKILNRKKSPFVYNVNQFMLQMVVTKNIPNVQYESGMRLCRNKPNSS